MSAAAFPWAQCFHLAATRLGWTPAEFWVATPRELAMALGQGQRLPIDRAALDGLMARFPDKVCG